MDQQAVADLVAQTRTDTIIATSTYGGALATAGAGLLNWLGEHQSGLAVLAMLCTASVSVLSGLYGMYHRHRIREIAAKQGFEALRRSDQ